MLNYGNMAYINLHMKRIGQSDLCCSHVYCILTGKVLNIAAYQDFLDNSFR